MLKCFKTFSAARCHSLIPEFSQQPQYPQYLNISAMIATEMMIAVRTSLLLRTESECHLLNECIFINLRGMADSFKKMEEAGLLEFSVLHQISPVYLNCNSCSLLYKY